MVFVFWLAFSAAVGVLASKRGRNGFGWFVLSCFITPILGAIFVLAFEDLAAVKSSASKTPSAASHRKCPACAEWVRPEASVCKHCQAQLTPDPNFHARKATEERALQKSEDINLAIGIGAIVTLVAIASTVSSCAG